MSLWVMLYLQIWSNGRFRVRELKIVLMLLMQRFKWSIDIKQSYVLTVFHCIESSGFCSAVLIVLNQLYWRRSRCNTEYTSSIDSFFFYLIGQFKNWIWPKFCIRWGDETEMKRLGNPESKAIWHFVWWGICEKWTVFVCSYDSFHECLIWSHSVSIQKPNSMFETEENWHYRPVQGYIVDWKGVQITANQL